MWAATGGHRKVTELFIRRGADINLVDKFGSNILHLASLGGDVEVMKHVLSKNMLDINGRVTCGKTAVMMAAENRHKEMVEFLVDQGADVSLVDGTGDNILHCACRGGNAEVVKYILLQEKVDINSLGHHQKTPLMIAGERGHTEVLQLFLHRACCDGRADVVKELLLLNLVDINRRGRQRMTSVMLAAKHGHIEVVELLIKYGADLTLKDEKSNNILHIASDGGQFDVMKYVLSLNSVNVNIRGRGGRRPVMIAAEKGYKEMVELLVRHKANLLLGDRRGDNTLHRACNGGHFDVVKYILSLNSVDINSRGWNGRRPVMIAAEKGYQEMVELLEKHGANLLLSDRRGDNTLHRACCGGHFDVVKYILSLNSVDINSRGWLRRTPVMEAAEKGHKEVVELLVKHGADLSLYEKSGRNILHNACYRGLYDIVKYVLSLKSVDINSRGWKKRTPVMVAAERGYKKVVELLVKNEANLSLRDEDGKNILDLAHKREHLQIVQYVKSLSI
ncbi:ankyrin repeat domain-containing protein 50-like [Haliotis asinina]|uniref:ankyrin repeat domain-containing protein 50-like n=1 Tax=Haliotis asinina TaxID=109174 RepID=UPI00353261F4